MSHNVLKINFTDEGLNRIKKESPMLVLKEPHLSDSGISLVWLSTNLVEQNKIEWAVDFQPYFSNLEVQNGTKISKLSDQDSIGARLYNFGGADFQSAAISPFTSIYGYNEENKPKGEFAFVLPQFKQLWPRAREPEIPIGRRHSGGPSGGGGDSL